MPSAGLSAGITSFIWGNCSKGSSYPRFHRLPLRGLSRIRISPFPSAWKIVLHLCAVRRIGGGRRGLSPRYTVSSDPLEPVRQAAGVAPEPACHLGIGGTGFFLYSSTAFCLISVVHLGDGGSHACLQFSFAHIMRGLGQYNGHGESSVSIGKVFKLCQENATAGNRTLRREIGSLFLSSDR